MTDGAQWRTLRLVIDFEYVPETVHGDEPEAMAWFRDEVLMGTDLWLLDYGDIGDAIGRVRVVSGHEAIAPPPQEGEP